MVLGGLFTWISLLISNEHLLVIAGIYFSASLVTIMTLAFDTRRQRKNLIHMQECRQQERAGRIKAERSLKQVKTQAFALSDPSAASSSSPPGVVAALGPALQMRPVATVRSAYPRRNGTPRQACLVPSSRGDIIFHNWVHPHLSLDSLSEFSHVWVLFVFHFNTNMHKDSVRPRIRPPRLGRTKVGIYATRTPHRPNSIGMSLCRILSIEKGVLRVTGIDLVSGTPVLDVKPFVKEYDSLPPQQARVPQWLEEPLHKRDVVFSEQAEQLIASHWKLKKSGKPGFPPKSFFETPDTLKTFLVETLSYDIRGIRQKEVEKPTYQVHLDVLEIIWRFSNDDSVVVIENLALFDPDETPYSAE